MQQPAIKVTPAAFMGRATERRESLSNKLIKGFLSFINGTEKQNTEELTSPDKLSLAMDQINEEEEEFE